MKVACICILQTSAGLQCQLLRAESDDNRHTCAGTGCRQSTNLCFKTQISPGVSVHRNMQTVVHCIAQVEWTRSCDASCLKTFHFCAFDHRGGVFEGLQQALQVFESC